MQPVTVNDELSVCGAIDAADVTAIKNAGFRSIICNRFDNEDPGQTSFSEIEAAAADLGLKTAWLPVDGMVGDEAGEEFGRILDDLPKPVFAYCRAGTRCIVLWSLSQAGKLTVHEIMSAGAAVGYDLRGLAPRIEAMARKMGGIA